MMDHSELPFFDLLVLLSVAYIHRARLFNP
jgi:hypothetical protein